MITILSGYQFQVSVYLNWLINDLSWQNYDNEKINIVSATIKSRWRANISNEIFNHKFRLTIGKPINDLYKIKRYRFLKDFDDFLLRMPPKKELKNSRLIYGLAHYSLNSFQFAKDNKLNSTLILDRACSHINTQIKTLDEEYKKFNLRFTKSKFSTKIHLDEYNIADKIVVPSNKTLDTFVKEGIPKEKLIKISLTSNFIKNTNPIKRKIVHDQEDKIIVGFLGGSFIRKGLIYLLKAWDQIDTTQSVLVLKINKNNVIWNHEVKNILRKNKNIIFLNEYIDDITEFYKSIDIFCLPSIEEGFGMSVIEAYYYNSKIICSDAVGAAELIQNDINVELFKNRNIDDLSNKLDLFIKKGKKNNFLNLNYKIKDSSNDYIRLYK